VETSRFVDVGPLQESLSAEYDADLGQLFTELGYAFKIAEKTSLEPFAGVAWSNLDTAGFREIGGVSALGSDGYENELVVSTLGLRARREFNLGSLPAQLRATLAWQHAFGDDDPTADLAFGGGSPFTIHGAPIDRDAALIEVGAAVNLTDSLTLGAAYVGRFSSDNQENTARASVIWNF
jgi:outer membrane autotransporter protein